ncbi:MAG: lolB [Solimicrobium sp.]|jgi:outer membrane lipoprotein LolB|nr:lolB [Solimicrobium sp.]
MINFIAICLLFFLNACSHVPISTSGNLSPFPAARQYHQQIEISGRLAAHYEQNNKPQAIHIKFSWSQTPEQTFITLTSPMGQTLATLLVSQDGAQLNYADNPPQFSHDANQLLIDTLGWPMPVTGLRDWLQGFTDANHYSPVTSAATGQDFVVDGWSLNFTAWELEHRADELVNTGANEGASEAANKVANKVASTVERPKRLDLMRQTEQAGLISLRIMIDEWNILQANAK